MEDFRERNAETLSYSIRIHTYRKRSPKSGAWYSPRGSLELWWLEWGVTASVWSEEEEELLARRSLFFSCCSTNRAASSNVSRLILTLPIRPTKSSPPSRDPSGDWDPAIGLSIPVAGCRGRRSREPVLQSQPSSTFSAAQPRLAIYPQNGKKKTKKNKRYAENAPRIADSLNRVVGEDPW